MTQQAKVAEKTFVTQSHHLLPKRFPIGQLALKFHENRHTYLQIIAQFKKNVTFFPFNISFNDK